MVSPNALTNKDKCDGQHMGYLGIFSYPGASHLLARPSRFEDPSIIGLSMPLQCHFGGKPSGNQMVKDQCGGIAMVV